MPPPFLYFRLDRNGFFLAFYEDALVGSILADTVSALPKPRGKLWQLAVDPRHRRKGVGSKLLGEAIDYLQSSDLKSIEARTWNSTPYIEFYKKHGFEPTRRALRIEWDLANIHAVETGQDVTVRQASVRDLDSLAKVATYAYVPYWNWSYEDYGGMGKESWTSSCETN